MFGKDKKDEKPVDIFSAPEVVEKKAEEKVADPIIDITRRDIAMVYIGMALETRRNFSNNTKVMKFLLAKLKSAVVASVPEYTPDQLTNIQKSIRKEVVDGMFMREIDRAIEKITQGKDPMEES